MPRVEELAVFSLRRRNGCLSGGAMEMEGTCPAVMNAMVDALNREYGIRHVDMPSTPGILWGRAIRDD
ncbi:MAG: hypothetical protein GY743_24640 [Planctomycetaceae bacterium]|nr:hypothetical protein [Planctomycetaceae bacterium]